MYILGLDIGSSFIKVAVYDADTGKTIAHASAPGQEMQITANHKDWAEQDPDMWWVYIKDAIKHIVSSDASVKEKIGAIGITYQMHGLVAIDKDHNAIRPSIIWCDSRAVQYGKKAFEILGKDYCNNNLLNRPGNFTASKLRWIKDYEREVYESIWKILLPGDYIALKLTGEANTTLSGLSEGIFWDFRKNKVSKKLLEAMQIDGSLLADLTPTFGVQGYLTKNAAGKLGLKEGIPVAYRSGDQPNNAFSLNVMNPGEIAANAGTSGVLYAVSENFNVDKFSRINAFAHVNHSKENIRIGQLLCINGTGIANAWIRKICSSGNLTYDQLNEKAATINAGAEGIRFLPFGNGSERMFQDVTIDASVHGLSFNVHGIDHLFRAVMEGVAFSFKYGLGIFSEMGTEAMNIKASYASMFKSELFSSILSSVLEAPISIYSSDGAVGAAMGAALGSGYYSSFNDCFQKLIKINEFEPDPALAVAYSESYLDWKKILQAELRLRNE